MQENNEKDELIEALKKCEAVKFGQFTLASGKNSKYYVDIKKAISDPVTLKKISDIASARIDLTTTSRIGGVALGGVPLATAVSLKTEIPLLLIRKDAKAYGTGGRFVGELEEGDKVILIEDVTTSGGSVLEAVNFLRDFGATVDEVITVVDREEGAEANLWNENVTLNPLVKASDLLKEE